ncbi:hypothetical protein IVB45_18530 [Bradyrhizobium sp. 4]|uniref:hypothetical protein n=1 Tax=unclassified Bradyrhizobium TaxID=2631580 RepID=UPI001FFB4C1C|nr:MULTISPECIES: hypothetical protein [unclassified Bradyrhizobium]MCK1400119.1 hypothetical protein [Bradyrhizobium sp. 39]MCK1750409.1 hypothetical protein [Bradyrhizobium sp. 135]UPJ32018.1 hypothetical protein IVB45_18530 [Bradyrhizobium sp. 4]
MRAKLYSIREPLAGRLMAGLRAGQTPRAFGVSAARLEIYFKDHPEYAATARPLIEANAVAAQRRKGNYNRSKTHCKFGHPFVVHQRLNFDKGSVIRKCNMCHFLRYKTGGSVKPEVLVKVKAALERGIAISSLTSSGRSTRLLAHHALRRARRENPEIDRLAAAVIEGSRSRALHTRWMRVRNEIKRAQNNDYYSIRSMLPASFPDRDDVVSAIFEDILTGALKREDVKGRVRAYVTAHNQMFATKYRKFGDSPLVSLDEAVFDDGPTTRGDTVSRGLWD